MLDYRVQVDLKGFTRFEQVLRKNTGEVRKAYADWSKYYAAFIRKRFVSSSKGGRGRWKRLTPATIRFKKRKKYKYPKRILMATLKMRKVLNPRFLSSTARTVKIKGRKRIGIAVTYGGRQKYKKGTLVSQVMKWHNEGKGNLPRRRIFVQPNKEVLRKMSVRMEKAFQIELNK